MWSELEKQNKGLFPQMYSQSLLHFIGLGGEAEGGGGGGGSGHIKQDS